MIPSRLELALKELKPSDWARFEKFASAFLAADFGALRTTASPGGDEGRDAELFSPLTEPTVVLQYSVATDWGDKIERTVKRLEKTHPSASHLVFLSNQVIGAGADSLKRKLRQSNGLSLDVRDRSWFVERVSGSSAYEKAAEELAKAIVDPYLAAAGVTPVAPGALSSPEALAAMTLLGLQWQDDNRAKGLTKVAFEALVRAVLSGTHSERRMHRKQVQEGVSRLLPGHRVDQVFALVASALKRLTKRAIRHWPREDEFCLTHEERQRVDEYKTQAALAEEQLAKAIRDIGDAIFSEVAISEELRAKAADCVRAATDAVLLERSQAFAVALQTGSVSLMAEMEFTDVVVAEISRCALPRVRGIDWLGAVRLGVREVLLSDEPAIQAHMRRLADAYTLMAFLRETPDVQSAVEKMFSYGKIWLDASVVLPLLAEPLQDGPPGRFTRMILTAREAGLELFVTPGAIEEIERHMNRAMTCARRENGGWVGNVPYLLERFLASGRSLSSFAGWLETFRGSVRPEEDVSEFLEEQFGIATRSLKAEHDAAPQELRYALQSVWYEAHQRRRERQGSPLDENAMTRLVEHDVECYCGIVQLRKSERSSPFGYSAWWLTVDRTAFDLRSKLRESMRPDPPDSPVLSADFLVNYLAFGPVRKRISKSSELQLPLLMEIGSPRYLTPELLAEADRLRQELKDVPEHVVRRRVRDQLDMARRRLGPIARAGMADIADEF